MKITKPKSNIVAIFAYVAILFCGSYYLSSNHKNLIPGLILVGGGMTIGGVLLGMKK